MEVYRVSDTGNAFKNLTKIMHEMGQALQTDLRTENKSKTLKRIHADCYAFYGYATYKYQNELLCSISSKF